MAMGDVLPSAAPAPPRRGWRLVLGKVGLVAYFVGQGLRLGVATRGVPLLVVLGGELAFVAFFAVILGQGLRRGTLSAEAGRRYLVWLVSAVLGLTSFGVVIGRALPSDRSHSASSLGASGNEASEPIPGAPGYSTFYGHHGSPLAIGRPWGQPCTPVRFIVDHGAPPEVWAATSAVVAEARRDGLNVTLQSRTGMWIDNTVYYPPGLTSADVANVYVGSDNKASVRLPNGYLSQISTAFNSQQDGAVEKFTSVEGWLRLRVVKGNPALQRVAVRILVGHSQGIDRSPATTSGLLTGTALDGFSASDVAAMRLMSGCGTQAVATVTNSLMPADGSPSD